MSEDLRVDFILKPDNGEQVLDGDIVVLRCRTCCKFIKKNYGKWYCPHCGISFVEGIDKENIECTEELMMYMNEIKEIGGW
jgi:Zn finger protein HypA/HybF involved in hydrogenase expression